VTACVSDLALERYLHDELGAGSDRDHIVHCVQCRADLAAKRRLGDLYMRSREARQLAQLLATTEQVLVPAPPLSRRRWLVAAAVAGALAAIVLLVWPRDDAAAGAEAEVLAVERAWMTAYRTNDSAALDRILADDYRLTDNSGHVRTKADDLARARTGELHFDAYDLRDVAVRVWGDTAVVTGHAATRGTNAGRPFANDFAFTDTLARIDGRWRAVAAHVSRAH
jgi:ketosteroid isomerase-like protein